MIVLNDGYYTPGVSVTSQKTWYRPALLREPQDPMRIKWLVICWLPGMQLLFDFDVHVTVHR